MKPPSQNQVTQLLLAWSDGDQTALEELTPLEPSLLRPGWRAHTRFSRRSDGWYCLSAHDQPSLRRL